MFMGIIGGIGFFVEVRGVVCLYFIIFFKFMYIFIFLGILELFGFFMKEFVLFYFEVEFYLDVLKCKSEFVFFNYID